MVLENLLAEPRLKIALMTLQTYNNLQSIYLLRQSHYSKVKGQSRLLHDNAHLHPPPPHISLPSTNFLHFKASELQPRQDCKGHGHYGQVEGHINVTQ